MKQIKSISGADEFAQLFNVSRETLDQLVIYEKLLEKWQNAVNLVAPSTLNDIWFRHIGDSAQIVDIVKKSDSSKKSGIWLDIGSGGGFPGLVAAIMLRDQCDYRFHLVESNGRKCAFLSDVVRHLSLPVDIHKERIEKVHLKLDFEHATIISARALASLDQLLEMSKSFVGSDTVSYFFKGRDVQKELDIAAGKFAFHSKAFASLTSSDSSILEITDQKIR